MTDDPGSHPDVLEEARRLVVAAEQTGLRLWLLGGAAIHYLLGDRLHPGLARQLKDIDFVTLGSERGRVIRFLTDRSYVEDGEFNAIHGARRLLFYDNRHARQLDVFVDVFEMCHSLPLPGRLGEGKPTLHLAELVLTKLQIVRLNAKDRQDLYALLLAYGIADHDDHSINGARVAELCSRDWGLFRTLQLNLQRLRDGLAEQPLSPAERAVIALRVDEIAQAVEEAPKSRAWRLRARVGDRVAWYQEPDEVDPGAP